MHRLTAITVLAIFLGISALQPVFAGKLHNRHFRFKLSIPSGLRMVPDTTGVVHEDLYYDTTADVIMMISGRESKFKSVKEYIDCSKEELETILQKSYGDPSLSLVSCRRFAYFPEKTTVIHFRVSVLPYGYNSYIIYFIHHRRKDIQISFTYKKSKEEKSIAYIDNIMETLKLK